MEEAIEGVPPGTVLDGKFRVERMLGIGGMGAVYEITHEITKHRRAMKLLHPQFAQHKQVVERFLREASAAGRIGNAHIVETYDGGWLSTGEPYLVMDFLEGTTLADRIEAVVGEGMPLHEVAELMRQVCDGVQAAHDAGIVHRDLKPENLFVSQGDDGAPFVRILDFGISKFDVAGGTKLTGGGAMLGTPAYMSPEQFDDTASVTTATDVYALGVILYEAVVGEHPYPASSLTQLVRKAIEPKQTNVHEIRARLPVALSDLLARAMASEPDARPPSARALADELVAIADATPLDPALRDTAMGMGLGLMKTAVPSSPGQDSERTPSSARDSARGETEADWPPAEDASPSSRGVARTENQEPSLRGETQLLDADEGAALARTDAPKAPAEESGPNWTLALGAVVVLAGVGFAATQLGGAETSPPPSASVPPPSPTMTAQAPAMTSASASAAPRASASVAASVPSAVASATASAVVPPPASPKAGPVAAPPPRVQPVAPAQPKAPPPDRAGADDLDID